MNLREEIWVIRVTKINRVTKVKIFMCIALVDLTCVAWYGSVC